MLSAFPSFQSILSLLEVWAEHERARPGAVGLAKERKPSAELVQRLAAFDDVAAFEVLAQVDERWAKGRASVGDLLAASEALAQLALLFPNGSAAKDALKARALASLALAKSCASGATTRLEAMVVHALDYGADSRAAGEALPQGDLLRAFLLHDVDALERATSHQGASSETLFLYGRALMREREGDAWVEWYQALPKRRKASASVLASAVDIDSVPTGHRVPNLYAAILMVRFGVPIPEDGEFDAPLLLCPQLGAAIAAQEKGRPGRFAAAVSQSAAYQGACVGALRAKLRFYTDWLSDWDAALALARKLPDSGIPELADMRAWTELLAGRSRDWPTTSSAASTPTRPRSRWASSCRSPTRRSSWRWSPMRA